MFVRLVLSSRPLTLLFVSLAFHSATEALERTCPKIMKAPCNTGEICSSATFCCRELCHGKRVCHDTEVYTCSSDSTWGDVRSADPLCAFVSNATWCKHPLKPPAP